MTVTFEQRTEIKAAPERVFDLSLDIDEHLASMRNSGERAVAGVTAGQIGLGEEVTWVAKHFGIPWRMTSKVTSVDRPRSFIDEQVRGPFKRFHHEHVFEAVEGGTLMVDRISFDAPAGPVGQLVERVVLGRYLEKLIRQRGEHLRSVAEAEPA